ncbi:MAG: N-acetylmuramoyl-L-alanine amidase [Candidatus Pelagibacter sp.]
MPKNVEKMSTLYSPNFDSIKRSKKNIKYLIFHYTGMKNDKSALNKLIKFNSKVSCHYYIDKNGKLIQLVPDLYPAWHAGKSHWKNDKSLNKKSLGIEISNPGHEHGYKAFNEKQINCLIKITKILIKKYRIQKQNILGHSDIAPLRKKDPGERFPWKILANKKIGIWHKLSTKETKQLRGKKINIQNKLFIKKLKKFGYFINTNKKNELKKFFISFQRRFRPEIIDGKIDRECFEIVKSLISSK